MKTRHEELLYWYTRFEDPNCLAVVELVATVMDADNAIQVSRRIPIHASRISSPIASDPWTTGARKE